MKKSKKLILLLVIFVIGFVCLFLFNKKSLPEESIVELQFDDVYGSSGRGFIYKKNKRDYYILTNYHVLSGKKDIIVLLNNGDTLKASRVGLDKYLDLAIIKINTNKKLPVLKFGKGTNVKTYDFDSKEYLEGQVVEKDIYPVTVDNKNDYAMELLKTDIKVKDGYSGSPLLSNNKVVGVITLRDEENNAFVSSYESFSKYLSILEKEEIIERPSLGIKMTDAYQKDILNEYSINIDRDSGVVVLESTNEGLEVGDTIIEFNSNKIDGTPYLRYYLFNESKGSTVKIKIIRNGEELVKEITLL